MPNFKHLQRPFVISLLVLCLLSVVWVAVSAQGGITFTQGVLNSQTGSGEWTGPMSWYFPPGGWHNANLEVTGLPATGSMVINYSCTATGNTYWGGRSNFALLRSDGYVIVQARADGGEPPTQSSPSNCTDSMTLTLEWSVDEVDHPVTLRWDGSWADYFTVNIYSISVNGTTVYPMDIVATSIPQAALPCITGTTPLSPTMQATITPYGRSTGTPAPTRTPGGPTPTPSATRAPVSGTVSYDSGLITFDSSVIQLSAVGIVNSDPNQFLSWSSAVGNDGRSGVAMLHAGMGDVYTVTAQEMISGSMVAIFKTGGYVSPVAVSLYGRTAYTLTTGYTHSIRVWYLDPDYGGAGQGVWVTSQAWGSGLGLSNSWRKLGAVVTASGGSGKIAAIGFTDERQTADPTQSLPPCPSGRGCAYMDDLRIAYGDAAGMVLPICGADGTTGTTGITSKICHIDVTTIDLQAACVAPTTIDFGAWLSYFWCRLWRFLGFFDENREQWDALIARQSANEPFGSLIETSAVADDLSASIDTLAAQNQSQAQDPIDWVRMFMDGSALDHFPQFTVPNMGSYRLYLAGCLAENKMLIGDNITTGTCMSLYMMRQTIIVGLFQWGLNAVFVICILLMIRSDLEKLAS